MLLAPCVLHACLWAGVAILAAIAGVLLWRRRRARRLTAKYLEPASTAKTASNTERG